MDPRKGFVIGGNLGLGGTHFDEEFNQFAGFGGILIGAGLTEKILVMGESFGGYSQDPDFDLRYFGLHGSTQIFIDDHLYLRPAIGFAYAEAKINIFGTSLVAESNWGFSSLLSGGYEFRMGKNFALSPEGMLHYARIEGSNVINYGVRASAVWYL